jgi:hypothetical protein
MMVWQASLWVINVIDVLSIIVHVATQLRRQPIVASAGKQCLPRHILGVNPFTSGRYMVL